ncbi:hypothetical protein SRHO_G00025420 [Serrasalmus rhombeus]
MYSGENNAEIRVPQRELEPLLHQGRGGMVEPIPAVFGRKAVYTLDRSPVHHRADRQTQTVCSNFIYFKINRHRILVSRTTSITLPHTTDICLLTTVL